MKCPDLALPVHDHAQGYRLDPACGKTAPHLIPQQGADLVADETVQDPPRLLRFYLVDVDPAGMLEGLVDRVFGNLVEQDPIDFLGLAGELFGEMLADRLALAIRVGREIDGLGGFGGSAKFPDYLFLGRYDAIVRGEIIIDIDPQLVFGQVFDVSDGSLDVETLAKIFPDGLGFRGRFDNNQ